MILNHFLFNRYPDTRKKVLQYGTLVSNSGFLGYPVAEGVYGDLGMFYASVFLIPLRLVMWSVGTGYFMARQESRKEVLKKVLTHPCLIAVYIGIVLILDPVATGIAVLMTGMPAGATTAIFAARYGSDAPFATKLTVLSTLLSMFTILFWCMVLPEP